MADIVSLVEKNLCVEDMDDFEEQFDIDLLDAMEAVRSSEKLDRKLLTGLIWIAKRHEDPDYTIEQARREPIMGLVDEDRSNPTKAAPKKSGKKPSTSAVARKR